MSRTIPLRSERLWAIAVAAVVLLALAWAMTTVVAVHRRAAQTLSEVEPRHARLQGLLQNTERTAQMERALQANLAEFVQGADADPAQIGNAALQRVRELATARGLRVASSQVMAPREEKDQPFDRIGLTLRMEGEWAQFQGLLADLVRTRPALYTDLVQMSMQGAALPGRAQPIAGQFDLYVLKERRP